jgi:hypothetical protein
VARPPLGGQDRVSWFEDPHFSLEGLTPGQRYTALIVIVLAVLMLRIGLPAKSPSAGTPRPAVPATTVPQAGP